MASLLGKIDPRGRPVVELVSGRGDRFLALVDTGFNGELMVSDLDARLLGFAISSKISSAGLAGDVLQHVFEATGAVSWMGVVRQVEVLVSPNPKSRAIRSETDPIALIGTRLLTPSLLLIDYLIGKVEIETQ